MQVIFHEMSWVTRGVSNITSSFYYSTGPDARCILWIQPGEDAYSLRLVTLNTSCKLLNNIYKSTVGVLSHVAGTLGCVFIDNETHVSGVTKCTTGEAWSAFSWHHSSEFHCQWTHNQVFLLLSHMLIKNAKSIFIYVMKYVSGFIWKLGINFAVFFK